MNETKRIALEKTRMLRELADEPRPTLVTEPQESECNILGDANQVCPRHGHSHATLVTDEVVERVARALCKVTGADPDALGVDGNPRWKGWAQFARAALAAMPAIDQDGGEG